MKRCLQFLRTTLVGGTIFLLPLLLVTFVLYQAFELATKIAKPLIGLLPPELVGRFDTPGLVAAFALLIFAFMAGLFARTQVRPGEHAMVREQPCRYSAAV